MTLAKTIFHSIPGKNKYGNVNIVTLFSRQLFKKNCGENSGWIAFPDLELLPKQYTSIHTTHNRVTT